MKHTDAAIAAALAELKQVQTDVAKLPGAAISTNRLYRLIHEIESVAHREYQEAQDACRAVLNWYDGPEGPEVMFAKGAEMLKKVREVVNDPH